MKQPRLNRPRTSACILLPPAVGLLLRSNNTCVFGAAKLVTHVYLPRLCSAVQRGGSPPDERGVCDFGAPG